MGVPGFNTWFARNHRHAYVSCFNKSWDHVYIDMASILHAAMKKAYNLPHFHKILFQRLDSILVLASPRKSVMFALDGPAPLAKLLTQRKRRARESIKSAAALSETSPSMTLLQPWLQAPSSAEVLKQPKQSKKKATMSTMGLTPGTPLMAEIERSLEFYICQRLQRWKHLKFELSGARVQGEGETKILKRINSSPKGSHVIVGNDSDIILMSLMCPVKQLYILAQQTQGKANRYNCISLDALNLLGQEASAGLEARQAMVLAKYSQPPFPSGLQMDLVLCAIVAKGNDYLPALRGAGGPVNSLVLWKQYLKLRRSPQWCHENLVIQDPVTQRATLNADLLIALLTQGKYPEYGGGSRGPRVTSANLLPPDGMLYAQGLNWVLNMYLKAECPNYRWTYDNEAPSMHQLVEAIQALKQPTPQPQTLQAANPGALLPSVCALALLPASGRHYMPQALQHLMDEGSPVADVFCSCHTCDLLAAENVRVTAAYMEVHAALNAATESKNKARRPLVGALVSQAVTSGSSSFESDSEALTAAASDDASASASESDLSESDPEVFDPLHDPADSESDGEDEIQLEAAALQDADTQQMQQQAQALRAQMNSLRHQKEAHLDAMHPYTPFPVDRLEQAVASVPPETFRPEELELNRFGESHCFTWVSDARLRSSSAEPFLPQSPAGMNSRTPISNVSRKPIIENVQQTSACSHDTFAGRQSIIVQAVMQQHQSWQKRPLTPGLLQRHAAPSRHAKMLRLTGRSLAPSFYFGMIPPQGPWRNAPVRSSLLTSTGLQTVCFGMLPL
ncbi:hypothetical protein ABBQ32_002680 [Trebouxia sp. C0010 RCD-2024]